MPSKISAIPLHVLLETPFCSCCAACRFARGTYCFWLTCSRIVRIKRLAAVRACCCSSARDRSASPSGSEPNARHTKQQLRALGLHRCSSCAIEACWVPLGDFTNLLPVTESGLQGLACPLASMHGTQSSIYHPPYAAVRCLRQVYD